jgi:hypothetical protein
VGCFGAGNRLVYVDACAEVHACPFCRGSVGNALTGDLASMVTALRARGCPVRQAASPFGAAPRPVDGGALADSR